MLKDTLSAGNRNMKNTDSPCPQEFYNFMGDIFNELVLRLCRVLIIFGKFLEMILYETIWRVDHKMLNEIDLEMAKKYNEWSSGHGVKKTHVQIHPQILCDPQ